MMREGKFITAILIPRRHQGNVDHQIFKQMNTDFVDAAFLLIVSCKLKSPAEAGLLKYNKDENKT